MSGSCPVCWGLCPCSVPFQLLERQEGGTLGTSSTPGVTHRKLLASLARGLKGAKFSVACVGTEPGPQRLPVGESAGTGH